MSQHPIWKINLFERCKEDAKKAFCKECREAERTNSEFKLSNFSVKALVTHLQSILHRDSDYAREYVRLTTDCQTRNSPSTSKIGPMDKFTTHSSGNLTALDKKMINFIACDNMPFATANSPWFRALCDRAGSSEKLKGESHYRKKLPDVYEAVKHKIGEELQLCEFLSFTSDIWSSKSHGFISLTAEGITKNWTIKSFTLAVREFSGGHTGLKIAEKLNNLIKEWKIFNDCSSSRVHAFVTDGASNMKKITFDERSPETFERLLPFEHGFCASHLLNRAVQQSFGKKDCEIAKLLASCKRIVGHVKHSIKSMDDLRALQIQEGLPQHQLIQEMVVRWNSTLKMLERLLEQKEAIDRMAFEKRNLEFSLSPGEWELLDPLQKLLKPVEEVSLLLQKSRISCLIPYAKTLVSTLSNLDLRLSVNGVPHSLNEIEEMREKLIEGIRTRFLVLEDEKLHALSMFVDPRFRTAFALDEQLLTAKVTSWLKNDLVKSVDIDENENDLIDVLE